MLIRKITVGIYSTNSYLIGVEGGEGIVIDPGAEGDKILKEINKYDMKVGKIIITHGHFDHIGAVNYLRHKTGAEVYIHRLDQDCFSDIDKNLSRMHNKEIILKPADYLLVDEDNISIEKDYLSVIHTPGHSPGGISLYYRKKDILFSGDTIFSMGIGRTDFIECNEKDLIRSIEDKLLSLPDKTVVYPGHGTKTTIGEFKIFWNRYKG